MDKIITIDCFWPAPGKLFMKSTILHIILILFMLTVFVAHAMPNPVITSVVANSGVVGKYQKLELTVQLSATYYNPFDFNQVNLKCAFTSPTGQVYNVDGFYFQDYTMTQPNQLVASGSPQWKIRFSPTTTGAWTYVVSVTDLTGLATYPAQQFSCISSGKPGFIHRSGNDLVFDNGKKFHALGTNLAWTEWSEGFTIYDTWLDEMKNMGANFTKITMAPWGFEIEWTETGAGHYGNRQNRAWALDWVFDRMIENDIYCQLNIMVHDELVTANNPGWNQNPYHDINGGSCAEPQDFLVNQTAKNLFKRKLRYINARWGYSPHVQSWEILSEADNTGIYSNYTQQTNTWLTEMSEYFQTNDLHNRPVSSGFAIKQHHADYWNNQHVDYTQLHLYYFKPDLEMIIYNLQYWNRQKYQKPVIVGEFALGHDPALIVQKDPNGIAFHNVLWSSYLSGSIGTAMSWWWNNYLYPQGLFSYFQPLSDFKQQTFTNRTGLSATLPFTTSGNNNSLFVYPEYSTTNSKPPSNYFILEPNGFMNPTEMNLGSILYGSFFGSYRNPPTFNVNYTKAGKFKVRTGDVVFLSKIKIVVDGITLKNSTASANSTYSVDIPAGEHEIFVDNSSSGYMDVSYFELENYAPLLRTFAFSGENYAAGWFQNRDYNWEYVSLYGAPPAETGGKMHFPDFDQGLYEINWFDGSGVLDSTQVVFSGNQPEIDLPPVVWDGTFEMKYLQPFEMAFTANPLSGDKPLQVQFTDQSTYSPGNVYSWFWDFGDGLTSTQHNPVHLYQTPGIYDITLIINSGQFADTLIKPGYITVLEPLIANFTADKTKITTGQSVTFTDLSTGSPQFWNWNFGDNHYSSQHNPAHIYTNPGIYTVTLTIQNGSRTDTEIKTNYIEVVTPLVVNFTANLTETLTGTPIQFTDLTAGNPLSWQWQFGNGMTSTEKNPVVVYQNPGIYSVKLKATKNWLSDSITKINYITIHEPLVAGFEADTTFTWTGNPIYFTDLSTGNPQTWLWNFGDNKTSTLQNPVHVYTQENSFTVTLVITNDTASSSSTRQNYVQIKEPLRAEFAANKRKIVRGSSVLFNNLSTGFPTSRLWNFGDGYTSTVNKPSHFYVTPGLYTVSLQIFENDSTDIEIKQDYIEVVPKLVADFTANKTMNLPNKPIQFTDLTAGSPQSWRWHFGDGTSSTLQNPSHNYQNPGFYTVSLRVFTDIQTDSIAKVNFIEVLAPLVANFEADTTFAWSGAEIHFSDVSAGSPNFWFWSFGDTHTSLLQNPSHVYAEEGFYTVSLEISNQLQYDSEIKQHYIEIREPLTAAFSADTTLILTGDSVLFTDLSTGYPQAWFWDFGDNSNSILQNPVHQYSQKGIYTVTLTIFENDSSTSFTQTDFIRVFDPLTALFSLTPNPAQIMQEVQFTDISSGDPIQWKWQFGDGTVSYQQNPSHTYNSEANYNISLWIDNGPWQDSVFLEDYLTVYPPEIMQTVPLQAGWSGISGFVNPLFAEMDSLFRLETQNLIYSWNQSGFYVPEGTTNTLQQWNPADGLVVKMNAASSLSLEGYSAINKTLVIDEGWSFFPVLVDCPQPTDYIEEAFSGALIIIKEIAGNNMYWPEEKVKTLQHLLPGKCYLIFSAKEVEFTFPECN